MTEETGVVTEGGGPASITADEGGIASDVNWSDMALEIDSDEGSVSGNMEGDAEILGESENSTESPPAAPAPVSTPAPATQGEAPPSPAETTPPVVAPVTAPVQPPTPPTSQEPPAQPSVPYAEWRSKQMEGLEKHYEFDDETSAQLLTEPELVLPKLAAKLHMEVVEHVMRSVQTAVPQWIQGYNQSQTVEQSAESTFFGANPDLKDPAYRTAILQMGGAYRQLNPNAPAEEAVKVIGNMVRSAMGLSSPAPTPSIGGVAPVAPAVQASTFTPARGGGGGAAPISVSDNPWAKLADEFKDDY